MRILHVLHPWSKADVDVPVRAGGSDAAVLLCKAAIKAIGESEHEVLVLGGSEEARRVQRLGVGVDRHIVPPIRRLALARRAVARELRSRCPDQIVSWDLDWKKVGPRDVAGYSIDLSLPASTVVGVPQFGKVDRREVRASLGVGEEEFAVGLLADPPSRGEATRFIFMLCMLHIIGLPVVGVISSGAYSIARATSERRLAYTARAPIVTDLSAFTYASACDVGVLSLGSRFGGDTPPAIGSERVLAAAALQAGVPVLTCDPSAIPAELHDYCLLPSGHPGHLSTRLLKMIEDPANLARAREESLRHSHGETARFTEQLRERVMQGVTP